MKYKITYECRSNERVYQDNFEFQSVEDKAPNLLDADIIEVAMRMSAKFIKSGISGLRILDISPMGE